MRKDRQSAIAFGLAVCWLASISSVLRAADPKPAAAPLNFKLRIPSAVVNYLSSRGSALSADGKTVWALGQPNGAEMTLAQFDAATSRLVRNLPFTKGNLMMVYSLTVAPNQRILAASVMVNGVPGTQQEVSQIRLWNLVNGKELRTLADTKESLGQLGFSSDGRTLVASRSLFGHRDDGHWEGIVRVWDLAANKVVYSQDQFDGMLHATAISPDGKTLYCLSGKTLHVVDLATGKDTATAAMTARDMPDEIAISPDGGTMVLAGQHLIEFWDVATLKSRKAIVISPIGGGLPVFTADSKTVAVPVYEKVCFFDSQTGEAIGAITSAHPRYVPKGISISGDGKTMSVVQDGGSDAGIQIYDTSKLEPPPEFKSAADAQALFPVHIPKGELRPGSLGDKSAQAKAKRASEAAAKAAAGNAASNETNKPATSGNSPAATPAKTATISPAPTPSTAPTKPAAVSADAFVGSWTVEEFPFRSRWTISQADGEWTIKALYLKHGKHVGTAHGADAKIVDGTLTFTRVFDKKKPDPGFSDDAPVVLEPDADHLNCTINSGAKTKQLKFKRSTK